jgi:hypothetical protein
MPIMLVPFTCIANDIGRKDIPLAVLEKSESSIILGQNSSCLEESPEGTMENISEFTDMS